MQYPWPRLPKQGNPTSDRQVESYAVRMATVNFSESAQKLRKAQREFILTELRIGLTFAAIARNRRRNEEQSRKRARAAYDSGFRFVHSIDLTEKESDLVLAKLAELKRRLEALGETFPS